MIRYVQHTEIDVVKWDLCIEQSVNSLVYAASWYLNRVSPGWDALIYGDYDSVMPLSRGRKFFINYLFQPFFTQQLGVFSRKAPTQELLVDFMEAIPPDYKFIDVNLNELNFFLSEKFPLSKRKNYILDLNRPYEKLIKEYNSQNKRNLKKARKANLELKTIPSSDVITFYRVTKGAVTLRVKKSHYAMLAGLMEDAHARGMLISKGVYSKTGELYACCSFLVQKGRIIFLLGTTSVEGRENGAMNYLFDNLILQFSNHRMILDFEGSEIPGVAQFFKGFGAEKSPYYKLKINRLPWILKYFKSV